MAGNTVPTTPAQGWPLPVNGDDPDVPGDLAALALLIEKRVIGVYPTVTERNTATAAAVLNDGSFAYTRDTNTLWYYDGTSWLVFPDRPVKIGSGATVPSNTDPAYVNGDVFFKV